MNVTVSVAFAVELAARQWPNGSHAAGLPGELDLHSLRHSYVTQLVETGFPERFITDQVGHAYAATTAIYTGVSDDYRNRVLAKA